jgi:hypothetical protein
LGGRFGTRNWFRTRHSIAAAAATTSATQIGLRVDAIGNDGAVAALADHQQRPPRQVPAG